MIKIKDGRTELYQWDTGSVLTVGDGIDEVHFARSPMGRSITAPVANGEAKVEDVLLQTAGKLFVWGFVGSVEDGYTKLEREFTVRARNKPADYVFTPPEQITMAEILEELKRVQGVVTPEAVGALVEEYLRENPVDGAVKIDDTLTKEGYAADAKAVGDAVGKAISFEAQALTDEQKAQARENIGAYAFISILESDPAEPKEGQMWILKTATEELTTPVIELGNVSNNSIEIKLSNASHDENGDVVTTYNVYVNSVLNKTATIAAGGTCVIDGLYPETEYQIFVRGVKDAMISKMSNTLTATTSKGEATEQEIIIVPKYTIAATDEAPGVYMMIFPQRAVAVSTSGKIGASSSNGEVQYYMLEVPDNATSCTVVCQNMKWGFNGWNTGSDGKLTYDVDSGWKSSGETYTFAVGAAEYVSIGFKKIPEAEFVAEDVANITVTFA